MRKSAANKVIIFMILCLIMLLGGCGNGGSSESGGGGTPTSPASTTVSGSVVDGFISNATIRAYQINANGTQGAQIGSPTTSSSTGAYTLSLGSYTGPVLIESSGGSFTDWATGAIVNLAAADTLKAVVSNATGAVTAQITPLTNMAAERAQRDIAVNGTTAATAIDNANTGIGQYFGAFNILTDSPIDPTVAGSATGVSQARVDYAMVLAGISKNAGANAWQPFSLVTAMALDASDGAFDGKQGATQVTVTTNAGGPANLPATAGKSDMGAAITAFQGSAQNNSGGSTTPLIITNLNTATGTYSAKPEPPTGLTATVVSSTQINLLWTASAGATGNNIYRGGVLLKSVTTLTSSDSGLTPNTQYCYAVTATDNAGNESNKSIQVCATTSVAAPPVPTGLTATPASQSQVDLAWSAGAGAAPAGYKIYKDGVILKSVTTTTSTDTGLTESTQYCYAVSSYDSTGNESAQTTQVCATTQPPPPPIPPPFPTGLTATAVSQSRVDLSWTASSGAASYKIYRGGVYLNTTSTFAYSDAGLTASTQYCYTVSAVDSSGNASAQSSQICVTTVTVPPPPPAGLAAVTVSTSQIDLSWTASAGAAGYKVYRSGTFLKLVTTTNTSDTGLLSGKQYCYQVTAYDVTGSESAQSLQSCATTTVVPTPGNFAIAAASQSQINLSWTASAGASGYRIYKDGTYLKSVMTISASDMGLTASSAYCYSVSAYDSANNESAQTSHLCATTYGPPPSDPGNLTTFVETPTKVILSWSASVGATEYYIYRNGTKIDTSASPVTGTTYTDTGATSNAQNIYKVTAINAAGSESSGLLNQVNVNTALTVPTMSSATANTSSQITIGWTNPGAGTQVAGYKIYRNGSLVKTIPSAATLTYADSTGLAASTQYCYRVSAIDALANESAQSSNSFCATTPTATGSIALSLTKSLDGGATWTTPTTSVSIDSPAKLTAIVTDNVGLPVASAVVSFSTISDLSFNPASGTALTAADGKASIIVNAGNTTGAATIRAAAPDPSGTAISENINLSVTPPNLSLSALTITPATLSAGGTAGVSITVNDGSGNPFTTSVPISFTSVGAQANPVKATITSQVYTVNGVASATYRDINYASVDTITATLSIGGTTFTKTGTITVNAASAGSISFISATPANIALKGTGGAGRSETSVVVFKVLDTNGNPISKKVNFSLNTTIGGLSLTTASADSDPASGLVQTIVQAGTVSTPVRVSATIDLTTISTTSDQLVISTGIPDQDSFSIAATTLNIEGWNIDGVSTDIRVRLADHFNNPVPDGTAVNFRSSGGSIQPSCTTIDGTCKVTFTSQDPRPANGRVRILAYALGEESFVDLNGNGIYDAGDTYTDKPEPFLDANEDGARGATEEFVDTNADGLYSAGDGVFNGILRDASISGATTIHVRNSSTVVLSGSNAVITSPAAQTILPLCTTIAPFTPGSVSFNVVVTDVNLQVMPAGTTISFSTSNGTILTPTAYVVPNTSTTLPLTYSVMIQSDATQSGASAPYTCTNAKPSGIFTVTVTTPKGVSSYQYTVVND